MDRARSWTPSTRSASSALSTPVAAMPGEGTKIAETALSRYPERFGSQYIARFRAKFGLRPETPVALIQECLDLLATQEVDFTLFFRHLTRVAGGEDSTTLAAMFSGSEAFGQWFAKWCREAKAPMRLADMRAANPILIPRNHRVEQGIHSAYGGD